MIVPRYRLRLPRQERNELKINRPQRGQNSGGYMKSQSLLSLSAWLLAALALPLTIAAQDTRQPAFTQYRVTDLGTLPGGNFSQPFFLNQYGLVSGSSSVADGSQHATLWLDGLMGDIGAPGLGGPNSIALGAKRRSH